MKRILPSLLVTLAVFSTLNSHLSTAIAQGTAFTYQGRLNDGANPASGSYDLRFALFDAASTGTQQGSSVTNTAVAISNGLFTVTLDFGANFPGADRWLEIGVRTNGGGVFTGLIPRQQLTAAPYAITAGNVTGTVATGQLGGAVPLANLPTTLLVTNGQTGVNLTGTFSGDGAGVTNVIVNSLQQIVPPIVAWGNNGFGQATVPAGLSNVMAIAGGFACSLALKSDGTVVAWGYNSQGQTNVPAGLSNAIAIAGGLEHCLALKSDGTVIVWGSNIYGQTNVSAGLSNVIAIAGGGLHNLALKSNGTVVAWGFNGDGQTNVPAGLSNVIAIAGGLGHSLALKSNGTVVAWGANGDGQTNVPAGLSSVMAVAGGRFHSLALKSDGTVVAWGYNSQGQTNVPAGLSNVIAIAGGGFHSLALKSDGTVVAWGDNLWGQASIPGGLSHVIALAGGYNHSLALRQERIPAQVALRAGGNTFFGNQIVADGNVGIGTVAPGDKLSIRGGALSFHYTGNDVPYVGLDLSPAGDALRIRGNIGSTALNTDYVTIQRTTGNVGIGINPSQKLHVEGNILASGTITPNSDRNAKTEFEPVDTAAMLRCVAALPIQRWRFKAEDPGVQHVGPMAQDFHAAFGLGAVPTAIATVDADGVALAAIQGLNQKLEEQRAQSKAKEAEIESLKQSVAELKRQMESLAAKKER